MTSGPSREPEDVDAAFAQIVADLEREGIGRDVRPEPRVEEPEPDPEPPPRPAEASWRGGYGAEFDWANDNEDEHYEPPEPPPLPRLRTATIGALALVATGVLLLVLPGVLGMDQRFTTPLGLIALASGIGLLLLRARKHPKHDPGDNGAEV